MDASENILDRLPRIRTVTADVTRSRFRVKFYIHHTGAILSAVVLLFHQQIQLVDAVKSSAVFFLVIRKRLQQTNHRYAAFMMKKIAHLVPGIGTTKIRL